MRLSCIFKVSELPVGYRMGIVSIIKECLRLSDEMYFKQIYGNQLRTKPFVFAPYLVNFRINGDRFLLDQLRVTFSSPDHEFLLHFYNGLQQKKQFVYKDNKLIRQTVHMLSESTINESSIVFRTQSPLLVEDQEGKPLAPTSPEYNFHFSYLANMILYEYRGQGLLTPLIIEPLCMKKVVIKETNHDFEARFGEAKYLFYTGYQGLFRLIGDPTDLQLLYQLGISKRRNQGFGLFRIA